MHAYMRNRRSIEDRLTCTVAAAVIGSAVVGAAASSSAAHSAARAQTNASRQAIAAQQDSESRSLELQRPFYNAGYQATAALMDLTGLDRGKKSIPGVMDPNSSFDPVTGTFSNAGSADSAGDDPGNLANYPKYNFQQDPGYAFRRDEGQRALERSRAASGNLNSGGTGRALVRYGQEYASNEYQKVYDRIATIAGYGRSAASQGSQTIVNTGQNVSNALVNAGEARASGYIAQGNAWSNAANQVSMYYGYRGGSNQMPLPYGH